MRIGMFVDAACDLPPAFIAANPLYVLPIPIRVGERIVIDDRDETATRSFYERVLKAGNTDVESQPYTEPELEGLFLDRLVLDFDYLVCLTIAASRSPIFGRLQTASFEILARYRPLRHAAGVPGPFAMRVFDSQALFAAQGVQVLELARLIRVETPVTRIFQRLEEIIPLTYGYMVPSSLRYLYARARQRGDRSVGMLGHALGNALDLKPVARCFRGETAPVAKVRHFAAAAARVFATVSREIERGLVVPFVNLSFGGDGRAIRNLPSYHAMARTAAAHGVELHWSTMSMAAGVNAGPGALCVGLVAQEHELA